MILLPEALPLLDVLAPTFTQPTFRRFSTLLVAAILTTGRRTVANLLRTLGDLAPGHRTDYQRVLSRAPWSALALGCALAGFLLTHLVPEGDVVLVGDDTVDGHRARRSTARPATATPSARPIATPPVDTATSGSSSPCWSASPSPPDPGPCRSWSTSIGRPRTIAAASGRTAPRRS